MPSQPRRAARSSGFFVRDESQVDLAVQIYAEFLDSKNRVKHGDNSALHVASAAAKQDVFFAQWLELLLGLRGDHIVMPVKIQRAIAAAIGRAKTKRIIVCAMILRNRFDSFALEA